MTPEEFRVEALKRLLVAKAAFATKGEKEKADVVEGACLILRMIRVEVPEDGQAPSGRNASLEQAAQLLEFLGHYPACGIVRMMKDDAGGAQARQRFRELMGGARMNG